MPAGPPATTAVLRSPLGLATAVTVLLSLVIAIDVFAIAADVNLYSLMGTAVSNGLAAVDHSAAQRSDVLMGAAAALQLLALMATCVVFVVWFHRVRTNGEVFSPNGFDKGRGWAIGGWFIPIGNLWIPFRIARDTWVASSQATQDGGLRPAHSGLVSYWWRAWVPALLAGRLASGSYDRAQYPDDIRDAAGMLIASDALDIAAAVLALLFVRKLTAMQHRKATEGPVALD
jgi:hypothetical protein